MSFFYTFYFLFFCDTIANAKATTNKKIKKKQQNVKERRRNRVVNKRVRLVLGKLQRE